MRSKRIIKANIATEGLPENTNFCRRCGKIKKAVNFYNAVDTELDKSTGLMSVCKECINSMFDNYMKSENGVIEKATLLMCRSLNIKYDENCIQAALSHQQQLQEKGKVVPPFYGLYKFKLSTVAIAPNERKNLNLTYQDVQQINLSGATTLDSYNPDEIDPDVISFWGEGLEIEDYRWLENEFDDWKVTHKADTKAERTLLKEIVRKQFAIEKANRTNGSTSNLVKELQDLMKTAAIDPSKANAASAGRTDTFGGIIKMIEDTQPADFYKDKNVFKDFDNLIWYFEKFIVRSIKNFMTGSRDFSIDSEEDDGEDMSLETEADIVLEPENNGEENGN